MKIILELDKNDLTLEYRDLPAQEVERTHLKYDAHSLFGRADIVIYIADGIKKTLKSRDGL